MSSPEEIIYHLSFSAPPYFVDQYEKCLAKVAIRIRSNPSQPSSTKFWDLYTAHTSLKSPEEAAKYVYTIFTGLGWEGLANLKVFLKEDKDIDGQVVNTLKHIGNFEPVLYKLLDKLDGRLGNYQLRRYTMAVTVLAGLDKIRHDRTFFDLFTIVKDNLGTHPPAVSFTISVLERSGWGDTRSLKPFASPNFDLNKQYPVVDLCLTVADYYGNMTDRDFSSAKIFTSVVHLNHYNVADLSRDEFVLKLLERGIISVGDVSKIEDRERYPIFFREYKRRHSELSQALPSGTMTTAVMETQGGTPTISELSTATSCTIHRTIEPTSDTDPLDAPPMMVDMVKFLKPISAKWELLGMCLGVKITRQLSASDGKTSLARVLAQWETTRSSPYTWKNLLEVVEDILEENLVAENIKKFVLEHQ